MKNLYRFFTTSLIIQGSVNAMSTGLPLHDAARDGDMQRMQAVFEESKKVSPEYFRHLFSKTSQHGWTPLYLAVINGRYETAKFLLEHGVNPNREVARITPLHHAVLKNDLKIAQLLVDCGADVNTQCSDEYKSYYEDDRSEYFASAFDENASRCRYEHNAPLHSAVAKGSLDMIQFLLDHNANVNAKNKSGMTPLALAEKAGQRIAGILILAHTAGIKFLYR